MTLRPDNRLDEVPMTPVRCGRCTAEVTVRKSSWSQTSVQWNAAASARCAERADAQRLDGYGHEVFLACSALGMTVSDAAHDGRLAIVDH